MLRLILAFAIFIPVIVIGQPQNVEVVLTQCSQAIHDSYTTLGPNGVKYLSWHPRIDRSHNCFFDHEHGSNPRLLWPNGPLPLFNYTMSDEGHNGFKVYVVDLDSTHRAMITHHFGTGNAVKAVCTKFHTFDIVIIDSTTGEVLANTHMMGDFGKPVVNETQEIIKNTCVDQAVGSNGIRQFPAKWLKNIGYEPWRIHRDHTIDVNSKANAFGFDSAAIVFNTRNPKTACDTITCTNAIQRIDPGFNTQSNGTYRTIEFPYSTFGFTGVVSGTFVVDGLQQYIKPNWSFRGSPKGRCWPIDPDDYAYQCYNIPVDATPFYKDFFIGSNN